MDSSGNMGMETQKSSCVFFGLVILSQVLGLAAVVLVGVWTGVYLGGFAWTGNPGKQFNYHPLFMVIGLIFLYGDALLMYRVFSDVRKVYVKLLHAALLASSLIFAVVGLVAVFEFHNKAHITNMYTLHSWVGIITVVLFSLQWLCGFVTFILPGLSTHLRSVYKPVHTFSGLAIFIGAIVTALMGILEKVYFTEGKSTAMTPNRIVAHSLALVMVAMGTIVAYIVTRPEYARDANHDNSNSLSGGLMSE